MSSERIPERSHGKGLVGVSSQLMRIVIHYENSELFPIQNLWPRGSGTIIEGIVLLLIREMREYHNIYGKNYTQTKGIDTG